MIESSNDYISYSSYESLGNDIGTSNANSMQGCVDACNSSTQPCYGFVYNNNTNTCSLKGGSTASIINSKQKPYDIYPYIFMWSFSKIYFFRNERRI